MKKKICTGCKKEKSIDKFNRDRHIKDGYSIYCKDCAIEKGRIYQQSKKGKRACELSQRKSDLKHNYNITPEQYDKMFKAQNGICFLCKKSESDRRLSVDHNHKTGKIRSLLCRQCNFLVGYVENNVNLIKRILNYIK